MDFFVTGRQGGKTHALVELMLRHDDMVMLCANAQEATRLAKIHPKLAVRFLTVDTFSERSRDYRYVVVDNLDLLLNRLLRTPLSIEVVTATGFSAVSQAELLHLDDLRGLLHLDDLRGGE